MRNLAALSFILGLGAFSYSFADNPPSASTASAQSTPASSATTAAGATATAPPASDNKKTLADAALVAQVHRLRSAGYKPKVKDGVTIWCKQQTALGSRLTQVEMCGSPEQVEQSIQDSKDAVETAQRRVTEHQSN